LNKQHNSFCSINFNKKNAMLALPSKLLCLAPLQRTLGLALKLRSLACEASASTRLLEVSDRSDRTLDNRRNKE
jgi:hypothetical protein